MMQIVPLTKSSGAITDSELWDRFRLEGDESAFIRLYDLHLEGIFQYGMGLCKDRDLVKELAQDLFCHLWERRSSLGAAPHVQAYLLSAFRNHFLQHARRNRRFLPMLGLHHFSGHQEAPILDYWLEEETQRWRRMNLASAMDSLPQRQREALHLRFYAGLTCDEIAQVMQMEVQSTYNLLHRGLQALRKKLSHVLLVLLGLLTLGSQL